MKDFKKILSVFAFTTLVIIALGFLASNATAGDCDSENGAAYGLCTAYCDAMDCDGDPQASSVACDKVQDTYFMIVGADPPCLARCGIGTGPGGSNEFPICGGSALCPGGDICVFIESTYPACETRCVEQNAQP